MRKLIAVLGFVAVMLIGTAAMPSAQVAQAGGGDQREPIWLYINTDPENIKLGRPVSIRVEWELPSPIREMRLIQETQAGVYDEVGRYWYGNNTTPRSSAGTEVFDLLLVRDDRPMPTLARLYPFRSNLLFGKSLIIVGVATDNGGWRFSHAFELDLGG